MILPSGTTTLSKFLINEIYDDFRKHRVTKEQRWQKAYDYFVGKDDNYAKWKKKEKQDWRSDLFIFHVKTKVMAAYSILTDVYLQGGKVPFAMLADPESGDDPKAMQNKIEGQFADCRADREYMKSILSLPLYGESYLKAPVFKTINKMQWDRQNMAPPNMGMPGKPVDPRQFMRFSPQPQTVTIPAIEYVSVWDMFTDPEEEDIQESRGVIQRSLISAYELRQKIGKAFYNQEAIEKVIKEVKRAGRAEDTSSLPPYLREIANGEKNILYLEGWVRIPKKTFYDYAKETSTNNLGSEFNFDDSELEGDEIKVVICTANGDLVRIAPNLNGKIPYHKAVFEPVLDDTAGRGLGDNLQYDQQLLNGIGRAISDNLKLSGNVILATIPGAYSDTEDGVMEPGKHFELAADVEDVNKAIQQFVIQDITAGLFTFFSLIQALSDENSNVPKLITGISPPGQGGNTAFEFDQKLQQAGKYLGAVIRNVDEGQTEPIVEAFYNFNMMKPGDETAKGDFTINATGFSSFQNRIIRNLNLQKVLQIVLSNPALLMETKLRPHLEEIYESLDLDTNQFLKTDQEKQADIQSQQMIAAQQQQQFKAMMDVFQGQVKEMLANAQKKMADTLLATEKAKTEVFKRTGGQLIKMGKQ